MRALLLAATLIACGCGRFTEEDEAHKRYRAALQAYCEEAAAISKRAESVYVSATDLAAQHRKAEELWSRIPDPPADQAELHERAKKARGTLVAVKVGVEIDELAARNRNVDKERRKTADEAKALRQRIEAIREEASGKTKN